MLADLQLSLTSVPRIRSKAEFRESRLAADNSKKRASLFMSRVKTVKEFSKITF
jgi:hypothetical protein